MGSRTSELILKATDQWTDTLKKTQAQFAATKIAADDLNKSVQKLEKLHPGLNQDEARAAAEALNRMRDSSETASKGFSNASLSARGLGQELGVTLPRAVTAFLSQSSLIGPALSAAFSIVAVVGLIEAIGQIPKAIDKVSEAFTGWNEKAQKVYEAQHERNQKAVEDFAKFQGQIAAAQTISRDPSAARRNELTANIAVQQEEFNRQQDLRAKLQGNIAALGGNRPWWERENLGLGTIEGKGLSQFQAELVKANEDGQKAQDALKGLNEQLKVLGTESTTAISKVGIELRTLTGIAIGDRSLPLRGGTGLSPNIIVPSYDGLTGEAHYPATLPNGRIDLLAEQDYQFKKKLNDSIDAQLGVGLPFSGGVVPTRPLLVPELLRNGSFHNQSTLANGQIDPFLEQRFQHMQQRTQAFMDRFKDASGQLWDSFFSKGSDILSRLANVATGWLSNIGKGLFENFATSLVFGSNRGISPTSVLGGLGSIGGGGGGLLGGLLGKFGGGASGSSGGGLLSLFGGGAGLLGGLVNNGVAVNAAGGTLGLGVAGAGPGISTGFGGALGLNGGAGLLGLGAATIPIVGGLAAAAALIAFEIFKKHPDAPFTRDPNEIQRSRVYEFYSSTADLAAAAKDMAAATHSLNSLPEGVVMKRALPAALNSSNQFRRQVNAVLQQDL